MYLYCYLYLHCYIATSDPDNPISRYVCSMDDAYSRLVESLSGEYETDLLTSYQVIWPEQNVKI